MASADIDYFRSRSEQERKAAQLAEPHYLAEIHLDLARAYEAMAAYPESRTLRVVAAQIGRG